MLANERVQGTFTRRVLLGESLDTGKLEAAYDHGVLTVTIPVAEQAQPRKIAVGGGQGPASIEAESRRDRAELTPAIGTSHAGCRSGVPGVTIRGQRGVREARWQSARILIQTEVGKAAQVAEEVGGIDGVVSAEDVTGPYDVVARAEANTVDELGKMVVSRVQMIGGITRTLTCPVVHL